MAKKELTKEEKAAQRKARKEKQAGVAKLLEAKRDGANIVMRFKSDANSKAAQGDPANGGTAAVEAEFSLTISPDQNVTLSGNASVSELRAATARAESYATVLAKADRQLQKLLGGSTQAPVTAPTPEQQPAAAAGSKKGGK